jgi:hypothetical protein
MVKDRSDDSVISGKRLGSRMSTKVDTWAVAHLGRIPQQRLPEDDIRGNVAVAAGRTENHFKISIFNVNGVKWLAFVLGVSVDRVWLESRKKAVLYEGYCTFTHD